jgi:hypothetical protein
VDWEVFAPDSYALRTTGGNVLEQPGGVDRSNTGGSFIARVGSGDLGEVRGRVLDAAGDVLPGVTIEIVAGPFRSLATTNANGAYLLTGVPNGKVSITASLSGFTTQHREWVFDRSPVRVDFMLNVGSLAETVAVTAATPVVDTQSAPREDTRRLVPPSQNVINLQQRAAGVLPVRIDVPKAGTSHKFVKPLVVDEETVVSFSYKRR